MLFLGLIRRYWIPKIAAKIQVQSFLFPFKETEFPYKEVAQNFKLNFLKKKRKHRLDFCPKPLDYVLLNFFLKNQSLIKTKIIYCWQWKVPLKNRKHTSKYLKGRSFRWQKVSRFSRFLALYAKNYVREFYQNMLTAKVCLYIACILSQN